MEIIDGDIVNDPRIDPRFRQVLADRKLPFRPHVTTREELVAIFSAPGVTFLQRPPVDPAIYESFAPSAGLDIRRESIVSAPDGNAINLQIIRLEGRDLLPCVYYIHGGGMMMDSCFDADFRAWGRLLAHQGLCVVMVDFRNCLFPSSVPEIAAFPGGLNDCLSGFRWTLDNAASLGIDPQKVLLAGESGGANLAIAVAISLDGSDQLSSVGGLFLMCPYLRGEWKGGPGTSADRNAGIIMDCRRSFGPIAYGLEALRAKDPLAWPLFATEEEVARFPPVVISVNECDPLRDDGVDFYRLLLRAGVPVRCNELMGTIHGAEVLHARYVPDIAQNAAEQLAAFAVTRCKRD